MNGYDNYCFQSYFSSSRTGQKNLGLSHCCISGLTNCEDTFISICSSIYKNLIHQNHIDQPDITTINSALKLVKDQPEKHSLLDLTISPLICHFRGLHSYGYKSPIVMICHLESLLPNMQFSCLEIVCIQIN